MPIKYAEITIVRNLEEETWVSYFKNLIGKEDIITNKDIIIISFDDGSISETMRELIDKQFKFGPQSYHQNYPIYFSKPQKHTLFLKRPIIKEDGNLRIDFKTIFKGYSNFNTSKKEPSIYNAIYEDMCVGEVLAIVKNGYNHRYFLAYDDSYFDKLDINYFVNMLFTNSFTYEIRANKNI
jgi:hypothetical protein